MTFQPPVNSPQVVLLDMDDMICRLALKALRIYNEDHGTSITQDDIVSWGMPYIEYALDRVGFFDDLEAMPGAIENIERLHASDKVQLRFVTSPWNPASAVSKYGWLARHFSWATPRYVHLTHDKWSVFGHYLLDDSPKHLTRWSHHWPNSQALTIAYPYNIEVPSSVRRFEGYRDPAAAWTGMVDFILERVS